MYKGLAFFKVASALAVHAGRRQTLVAANIANADTPGYRPKDLPAFSDRVGDASDFALRVTRAAHRPSPMSGQAALQARPAVVPGDTSPDGNAVALETEMVRAADIRRQHDLAVSTYRAGMDLLRASLGRVR